MVRPAEGPFGVPLRDYAGVFAASNVRPKLERRAAICRTWLGDARGFMHPDPICPVSLKPSLRDGKASMIRVSPPCWSTRAPRTCPAGNALISSPGKGLCPGTLERGLSMTY
jgi:hypothetical protein